jgi:hypothetical protein
MTLEKELLDFTNWLYDNNWKLIGFGMCLNTETKKTSTINDLAIQSDILNYYPQDFQVGEIVVEKNTGSPVKLTKIDYDQYNREYHYWYDSENGEEVWYGFGNQFIKIDN